MDDSLEKYISKHREEFDLDEPSEQVWIGIQKYTGDDKTNYTNLWKIAAMLLLVSTMTLLIERSGIVISEQRNSDLELSEFGQVETYYLQLITSKRTEMEQFHSNDIKRQFLEEISQLDKVYDELKVMSKRQVNETIITDAMITNLQMRLEVLNKQLTILKSLNQDQNESTVEI